MMFFNIFIIYECIVWYWDPISFSQVLYTMYNDISSFVIVITWQAASPWSISHIFFPLFFLVEKKNAKLISKSLDSSDSKIIKWKICLAFSRNFICFSFWSGLINISDRWQTLHIHIVCLSTRVRRPIGLVSYCSNYWLNYLTVGAARRV